MKFELDIKYRFEADNLNAAIEKAQNLGFLDESDEVEVGPYNIEKVKA